MSCRILTVYLHQGRVGVVRAAGSFTLPACELPPLCLPQALLPAGARFAGVGSVEGEDVYLYQVDAPFEGETLTLEEARTHPTLAALLSVALDHTAPQDFSLDRDGENLRLDCRDLEEQLY